MSAAVLSMPSPGRKLGVYFFTALFVLTSALLLVALFIPSTPIDGLPAAAVGRVYTEPVVIPRFVQNEDHILVWFGNGPAPDQHSGAQPGSLSLMDGIGTFDPLLDVPAQTTRVQACGDTATSPDGQLYAFYVGLDQGNLYVMRGDEPPVQIDSVSALTCLGGGTFRYSPDGRLMAYISYEADAVSSEFADGFLVVRDTSNFSEVMRSENVTAFDARDDSVAFVSFFTNDKNEADEAAVMVYSGGGQREVTTLAPASEDCKFTSAAIAAPPGGKLLAVMGHRCTSGDTNTNWQLYAIDPETRSATLAASSPQAGAFTSFARTNMILYAPNGSHAYFTVPDGITANTAGLKMINLSDLSINDVLEQQAVMATYNGAANAFPRLSPNGEWMAAVVTSPDNTNTITIWNLVDPTVPPIKVDAGSSGDTVSSMEFAPDGTRLMAIVGGDNSANNSLVAIDLTSGTSNRMARGRFGKGFVVSPDGTQAALLDWQVPADPKDPAYTLTSIITFNTGEVRPVFTGATLVEGKATDQKFAFPMRWWKPLAQETATTTGSG